MRNLRNGKIIAGIAAALLLAGSTSAFAVSSAVNISTRMQVQTGDNVMIAGFIITGSGQKKILIRALGPSLPVNGKLNDPRVELRDATGAIIATNDNWRTSQQTEIIATGLPPSDDRESALIQSLNPGAYTAIVVGVNNTTGVGLLEVYDLDGTNAATRLGNISTRGDVQTGDNVMIGGFIIQGDIAKRIILRVTGPSLGSSFPTRLMDPRLEPHDGNGTLLAVNDNWRTTQEPEIQASQLSPSDDREPAIVSTLTPGAYTGIVAGSGDTTGIALIEMFDLDQPPQADGSTLYFAQLRPRNGALSQGSGTATFRLAGDERSVTLNYSFANLTGPRTGTHIHGPDGELLFDIGAATAQADGSYVWVIVPVGNYTVADIVGLIKSGRAYLSIDTAAYPSGEISGALTFSSGGQAPPAPTPPPALPSGTPTVADTGRFLAQSTFGANDTLIAQVQNQGFDAFLSNQFTAAPSLHLPFVDASGVVPPGIPQEMQAWWTHAITGPDQLRQRVAFALSELFVVSVNSAGLTQNGEGMAAYMDVLVRDAFGNFRQLLEDITLNPAMGQFLDMLHNDKANPSTGRNPNENYAREVMQMFTIGVYRLNLDGSLMLDAQNSPILTYDQNVVMGLAAVFTGWNFAQTGTPVWNGAVPNYRDPMIPIAGRHQTTSKTILNGVVVPANQTAQQDLKIALDTIFNHPNVGPFVCQQLIQRLLTSNPSPAYVYRVASVFNNNGGGVRGDLKAVIRAILLDYEARAVAMTANQGYGHLREPVIRFTNLLRAFDATCPTGKYTINANALAQVPLHAPTVFNFFSPDFSAPGLIAEAGLMSPEFAITTGTTVVAQANLMRSTINSGNGPSDNRTTLDVSAELSLAGNPSQLVDHLNTVLMANGMSAPMRTTLINAITQIAASDPTERVRTALYLVINSPEFAIQK